MTPTRDQTYAALLALLDPLLTSNGGPLVTTTRRLDIINDVAPELMPYVGQNQDNQEPFAYTMDTGPNGWYFDASWYVYVSAPDMQAPSSPILNAVLDAILDLVSINPSEPTPLTFTAGGEVYNFGLWLNGAVQVWEGLLDNKAAAIIPLRIQVTDT